MRQRCGCLGMPRWSPSSWAVRSCSRAVARSPRSTSDLPEPDVHVRSPAEGTTGLPSAQVKSVPVGALGVAEPPLRRLEVGQRDGATEKVGDPALGLEPPHALGVRRRRGLEVALDATTPFPSRRWLRRDPGCRQGGAPRSHRDRDSSSHPRRRPSGITRHGGS